MPPPDLRWATPILVGAVVLWALYRRVRRSFGRQAVNPVRMRLRIGVLALVSGLLLVASVRQFELMASLVGGAACGAVFGYLGLRHTKFETSQQGRYYTPHTYLGLLLTAVFVGRIVFRVLQGLAATPAPLAPGSLPMASMSPATLATLGLLLGYYLCYYTGVLRASAVPSGYSSIQQP
jgi:uncharacterized YccA/Bax inhibitor family protein